MKQFSKTTFALYFRNFIFGVEDSLVSTVGLLSGVAIADVPRATIFLTGMVLIFVEGFSMGVGSFLSEDSSLGYIQQGDPGPAKTIQAGVIMFFSYFCAGFIPLSPYLFFENIRSAFFVSILFSLVSLFLLGLLSALVSKRNFVRTAFRMMLIGGVVIGLGILIGSAVQRYGSGIIL